MAEEVTLTLKEVIDWAQDGLQECAGSPVILEASFENLATDCASFVEVDKTADEIVAIFKEQAKRFVGCGANNNDRYGVLRRNPKNGWQYIIDLLTD